MTGRQKPRTCNAHSLQALCCPARLAISKPHTIIYHNLVLIHWQYLLLTATTWTLTWLC